MGDAFLRKLSLTIGLVLSIFGLCSCSPGDDATSENGRNYISIADKGQPISARFTSIAENAISEGVVEGIQFAIVEDGAVLCTKAFGLADRELNVPMTVDTPINVASISKPLTAWGMLAFVGRNHRDLNVSVRELMNERELYDEIFSDYDVSIRMLLSHTSGLSGPSVPVTPATESMPSLMDILNGKSSVPRPHVEHPPGSDYLYSGAGYLVLQMIIEAQERPGFADYMADTVLRPAQMLNSTYSLTPELLDRVAVYYRSDGRRRDPYHLPGAAGGLYSTANDMARFIMMYSSAGRSIREQIISDEEFDELLRPVAVVTDSGSQSETLQYALGHYTYETPEGAKIIFHAGGNPGLRALFIVALDRDSGFFAVANSDRGSEILAQMMALWGEYYGLTLRSYF